MRRLLIAATLVLATAAQAAEIEVAAASSLQDAVRAVAARYEQETHDKVVFNFGGSNVLARQINAGAPADVFLSADEAQAGKVRGIATALLVTTSLVVVSRVALKQLSDLTRLQRIAVGDPSSVPAGVYARQALMKAGLWSALQPTLIPMENVRAALAAFDNGSVDAAIVYRTDALPATRARMLLAVPAAYTPRIVFPAVLLTERGRRFYDFVLSPGAAAVFRRFGFVPFTR